jgi:hypothetical protein
MMLVTALALSSSTLASRSTAPTFRLRASSSERTGFEKSALPKKAHVFTAMGPIQRNTRSRISTRAVE